MRFVIAMGIVAGAILPGAARADGGAATPGRAADAMSNRARSLHAEGDELYGTGDIAKAYAAYSAAWSLKKHWQLAGALGDCEAHFGAYRDAAEHLAMYLREDPKNQEPKERARAAALFQEVTQHVGTVQVTVSHAGAEVFVEGLFVGISPLTHDLYVDPGQRLVDARLGTAVGYAYADARAGRTSKVTVRLAPALGAAAPQVVVQRPMWPVYLGGGLLTTVGMGVAYMFWSEADRLAAERVSLVGEPSSDRCHDNPSLPGCDQLQPQADAEAWNRRIAIGGIAVASGAAVVTFIYALREHDVTAPRTDAWVYVTPGSTGFGLAGRF